MTTTLPADLRTRAITLGESLLSNQSNWYQGGTFYNPWGGQWVYTSSAPAALCASLYRATQIEKYRTTCMESFNYAIDNLSAPGYFTDVSNSVVVPATDLERYVFCGHLAWAMFALGASLPGPTQTKWLNALKANIEYVESTGGLIWYENGNWVANKIRFLGLAVMLCKAMGDTPGITRYTSLYERTYTLLVAPWTVPSVNAPNGDSKWDGYGLVIDTAGGWADQSDAILHLAETNGGPPMPNSGAGSSSDGIAPFGTYDGDYAGLCLEHLTQWYVSTRDFRALRLLNGYTNKYFSTINTTTWLGDFSHGSRHNIPVAGIYTPTLGVLQMIGQRQQTTGSLAAPFTDAKVLSMWDSSVIPIFSGFPNGNVPYSIIRSWGNMICSVLYACEERQVRL